MENCFFIVIVILMIITYFQYFIRRCYIGGKDFRSRFDLVSLRETIIWSNHNIRVNGKPMFYNNYSSANIVLLRELEK